MTGERRMTSLLMICVGLGLGAAPVPAQPGSAAAPPPGTPSRVAADADGRHAERPTESPNAETAAEAETPMSERQAHNAYIAGVDALQGGDVDGARRHLEPLLSAFADEPNMRQRVRVNLVRALLEGDPVDTTRILALTAEATSIDESSGEAWNVRGRAMLAVGHQVRAEDAFRRATQVDEDNIYALNNLGFALIRRGAFEEAVTPLERARSVAETKNEPAPPYVLNNLGIALEASDRVREAKAAYQAAATAGHAQASANLARVNAQLREADMATSEAETDADATDGDPGGDR